MNPLVRAACCFLPDLSIPFYLARVGILKGKLRVRIGRDAVILDRVKRIAPARIRRRMLGIARKQRPAGERRVPSR